MIPQVSIIIPNYNHAKFLQKRIDSIMNQTFRDFELIILDDCSSDNSVDIIEKNRPNRRIKHIVYNKTNSGSTFKQWKKGVELAAGQYIWIAESDDFCDPNFLEIAIATIMKNNTALFYATSVTVYDQGEHMDRLDWYYEDLGLKKWKKSYYNHATAEIEKYLLYKNTLINASAVVFKNTSFINDLLSDSMKFRYAGDWLFWLQYLYRSDSLSYSVETRNYFRYHNNTTRTKIPYQRNREILEIYKWCCKNILKKDNDRRLLAYYFDHHIYPYPRKQIVNNLKLLLMSLKYSWQFPFMLVKYYFTGKDKG